MSSIPKNALLLSQIKSSLRLYLNDVLLVKRLELLFYPMKQIAGFHKF